MSFARLTLTLACVLGLAAPAALAGGSLSGTIGFSGKAPAPKKLDRRTDKFCSKTEALDQSILVSADGKALANVLVRLVDGPAATAVPEERVVIDQKACEYSPRVVAVVDGQKVEVRNSDDTFHNVHAYQGQKTVLNAGQPPKARPGVKKFPGGETIKLKCDVHPWMISYLHVLKTPFFAVTDASGKFQIQGIPPGTYKVEAWHEKLGTQTTTITIEEGKTAEPKLAFAAGS